MLYEVITLLKNAFFGLCLVLLLLGMFLEFKLAFWVTVGIPTSFLGGLLFLPGMDVSINIVSRITSYNVCYTKLLRFTRGTRNDTRGYRP